MSKPVRVLVLLAEGAEEMEAVIVIDVLRRAEFDVTVAGLHPDPITASRGVRLIPDTGLDAVAEDPFDVVVLPGGGPGTERLRDDPRVIALLQRQAASGGIIAAICAAARVLDAAGLLEGRSYTCHPGVQDEVVHGTRSDERVVIDGKLVTSQGPGTSFAFAMTLVELLDSPEKAQAVAGPMIL